MPLAEARNGIHGDHTPSGQLRGGKPARARSTACCKNSSKSRRPVLFSNAKSRAPRSCANIGPEVGIGTQPDCQPHIFLRAARDAIHDAHLGIKRRGKCALRMSGGGIVTIGIPKANPS